MSQCPSPLGVISYASPDVRTSPPRTTLRMVLAAMRWALGVILTAVRAVVLLLGYAVLGAGIALRLIFGVMAMVLLFSGGLRWEVVRSRTLRAAMWVDAKTLGTIAFLRRPFLVRLRGAGAGGHGGTAR